MPAEAEGARGPGAAPPPRQAPGGAAGAASATATGRRTRKWGAGAAGAAPRSAARYRHLARRRRRCRRRVRTQTRLVKRHLTRQRRQQQRWWLRLWQGHLGQWWQLLRQRDRRPLMAPRQVSVAAVAQVEAEGHQHTSPQCPHLHPHQYPPAQHRSGASAHSDPDPQLLPSVFTAARNKRAHQEYQSRCFFKFDQKLSRLRILNRMLQPGTSISVV